MTLSIYPLVRRRKLPGLGEKSNERWIKASRTADELGIICLAGD